MLVSRFMCGFELSMTFFHVSLKRFTDFETQNRRSENEKIKVRKNTACARNGGLSFLFSLSCVFFTRKCGKKSAADKCFQRQTVHSEHFRCKNWTSGLGMQKQETGKQNSLRHSNMQSEWQVSQCFKDCLARFT